MPKPVMKSNAVKYFVRAKARHWFNDFDNESWHGSSALASVVQQHCVCHLSVCSTHLQADIGWCLAGAELCSHPFMHPYKDSHAQGEGLSDEFCATQSCTADEPTRSLRFQTYSKVGSVANRLRGVQHR